MGDRMQLPDLRWPRPTDERDYDYVLVWSLSVNFMLFIAFLAYCWWRYG
jgi:hypothetical protein